MIVSNTIWIILNYINVLLEKNFDDNCGVSGFYRHENRCYVNLAENVYNRGAAREACRRLTNRTIVGFTNLHSESEMIFVRSLSCLPLLLGARRNKVRNYFRYEFPIEYLM